MEKAILASLKMRRSRDAAKTILGDKFTETLEPYSSIIKSTNARSKFHGNSAFLEEMVPKELVNWESLYEISKAYLLGLF